MQDINIVSYKIEYASCNICGSSKYEEICDIKIGPMAVPSKLVRCKECSLFYANPRPGVEAGEDFYRSQYHEFQKDEILYEVRIDIFKRYLQIINRFFPKRGKLIDVGCSMGYFMDLARTDGWEVKGVEISDYAVQHACNILRLDVAKANLKDAHFEKNLFDVATMWNVLEHLYDPRTNLIELNRILKKGGYLFMRLPNLYSQLKLFRLYQKLKFLFKNSENISLGFGLYSFHFYSFDKNSIKKLLELTGFSNVVVNPEPMSINVVLRHLKISGKRTEKIITKILDLLTAMVYFLTFGKVVISPSIFVIAKKQSEI